MKKLKKLFLLTIAALLIVTLASCGGKDTRNTSVPLSNLVPTDVVASSGDHTVTNKLFYDRLRAKGYDTFLNNIKIGLFKDEYDYVKSQINLNDATVNDYEQDLFDAYAADIFSTSSADTIKDLEEKDRDKYIQRYIDSSNNKGILLTKEQCLSYSFENDKIKFSYIPEEVINEKLINLAITKASKDALDKIVDDEKILDDDDKLVANSNYISETTLSSYYDSHQKTYGTYRAIIIQFNNLNEARNVIAAVEAKVGELTDSNALNFYANLYNTYYSYRRQLDVNTPFENSDESSRTVFVVNEDKNELNQMSSSISGLVTTTLEEDGQYLKQPFNLNNKYVMVYRGRTEFDLNKEYNITPYHEQVEWNKLKDYETAFAAVKAEVREGVIDGRTTLYSSTILSKRIKAAEISIYDPYFENRFQTAYSDEYEFITPNQFDNNNIFKLSYTNPDTNSKTEYTYSVDQFYTEQSRISGLDIVVELLRLEYAYTLKDLFLDSDKITDLEEEVDKSITSFKNDEYAAYPSSVGLELYLLATYGYTNREDAIKYNKVASSALSSYLNQKLFDEWALINEGGVYPDSHDIDYSKLNALDHILEAGNNNYANLFSINIDHILIYIDDDGDGSPDDPKTLLKNFSEAQKADFNAALLALSKAIYAEANCEELTKSNTILEILQYVVSAYNKGEALFSDPTKTWDDYKKYNFLLTAESLSSSGDTTQSNVGNYVEEFGTYVKDLYKKATENKLSVEKEKGKFYFIESLEKAPASVDDLCATQFGYHMIVVNSYSAPNTTKNSEASDTYGYQKNIEILINEKDSDTTDDNIYVIVPNIYNDEENKATMNQLFTYYAQLQNGSTSSFDSTVREVLASMFGDAITRYTSTDFQNFLLFNELDIKVSNTTSLLARQLEGYRGYLIRTSQSYDTKDDFDDWYNGSLDWTRPYNK